MITFINDTVEPQNEGLHQGGTYLFAGEVSCTQGLKAKDFSDRFLIAIEPVLINDRTCIGVDSEGFLWYKTDGMIFKKVNITASISN